MDENDDLQSDGLLPFDPRIQTENIAFDPKELVACSGCGRMNPPNRLSCIYCARELEIKTDDLTSIKPGLRKLELWEQGFNLMLREREPRAEANTEKIAALLSIEIVDLRLILDANTVLPLARVESHNAAAYLKDALERFGLNCLVLPDTELGAERPPVRLKGIDFSDRGLELKTFNTGAVVEVEPNDLALLVPGIIIASRVDALEKKRRGRSEVLTGTTTSSDESILDIYTRQDSGGFRVHLAGFDFSCLGEDKGLVAGENLRRLIVRLKDHAPDVKPVENYASVRGSLGYVWEVESRNDPQGLQRAGFGRLEFGSVAATSNLNQFTKYSRLQWHLL